MTEQPVKLSPAQVRDAGLDDWRQIRSCIKARYRTGDLASGMTLVNRLGEVGLPAQAHPKIVLTHADVVVSLSSPEVRGITARDIELARAISAVAAELRLTADVSGLTDLDVGLDTRAGDQLAPFYAALLDTEVRDGEPVDPRGQVPTVWWQDPSELDEQLALPVQGFEQRWHFDVWIPHDDVERRLAAVLDAGGRLVSDAGAPSYWVVEDADGNRSCICTTGG